MSTDPYLINGVALSTHASDLETAEGLQEAPEQRDQDIDIPGMHGQLDVGSDPTAQRRSYGPGRITFKGWIKGVDPNTGLWTGEGLDQYFARVSALMRMFYARNLVIDHERPDGTRRAAGHIVGTLAPAREPSSPWFGRWSAQIKIPGAFWTGLEEITASATVATGGLIDLSEFGDAEAPTGDGLITFGPGSNPTWIHGACFYSYLDVITSGRQLTVDCATHELGTGTGTAWTPDPSKVSYGPGPAAYELDPTEELAATLVHTGGGSMFASFTGFPKYLTS